MGQAGPGGPPGPLDQRRAEPRVRPSDPDRHHRRRLRGRARAAGAPAAQRDSYESGPYPGQRSGGHTGHSGHTGPADDQLPNARPAYPDYQQQRPEPGAWPRGGQQDEYGWQQPRLGGYPERDPYASPQPGYLQQPEPQGYEPRTTRSSTSRTVSRATSSSPTTSPATSSSSTSSPRRAPPPDARVLAARAVPVAPAARAARAGSRARPAVPAVPPRARWSPRPG